MIGIPIPENWTAIPMAVAAASPLIARTIFVTGFFPFGAAIGTQVIHSPRLTKHTSPATPTAVSEK